MAKKRGNGEGTIYRRPDGRWCTQITVYVNGRRKRQTLYGRTRKEVAEKLAKATADRDGGMVYETGKLTVGVYLDRWLRDSVKGTVKETTHANYSYITRAHISPALGRVMLKSLTPAHVRGFYGEKARTDLSAATVRKMHVVLRKALSQAVSDGIIPRNAADGVKPPRVSAPGEEIRPLTSEECGAFLEASRGERLEALYVLAVHCGLREGELLGLKWDDVDLEAGTLRVRRTLTTAKGGPQLTAPKTKGSRRTVKLTHNAVQALRSHLERQLGEIDRACGGRMASYLPQSQAIHWIAGM